MAGLFLVILIIIPGVCGQYCGQCMVTFYNGCGLIRSQVIPCEHIPYNPCYNGYLWWPSPAPCRSCHFHYGAMIPWIGQCPSTDKPKNVVLSISPSGDVVKGSSVTFTCSSGYSDPPVQSYILFKEYELFGTVLVSQGKIKTISDIQSSASGRYFCQAENSIARVNSPTVPLAVHSGPKNVILSLSPSGDVVKGSSVTFTCSSSDSNAPVQSYILFKGNTEVAQTKIKTISNIQPSDSGRYVCQAKNRIARVNSPPVTLDVHYPPQMTSVSMDPPGDIVEGSTVTLTCSSDANPPVDSYTWYTERGSSSISTGPQLVKRKVSPADSGQYTCQATNKHGSQKSSPHSLDVLSGPKNLILSVSPSGDVVKGSSVTFTCSSSDSDPVVQSYILFKGNTEVVAQTKKKTISNIQPSASGRYFCQAKNRIDTVNSPRVTLDVHYPPQMTSVSMDLKGDVVEGSTVTLTCSSDANPPVVNYTWYTERGSSSISTGPQLVKRKVSPADSGQYTCQATNKHGSQKSSPHSLDVLSGPKNLILSVSPSGDVVKGSSVTFTCSSSDSNAPIQSYILFKDNTEVAQGKIKTISDIQPSASGRYFCQAKNSIATVNSPQVPLDVHYPPQMTSVSMDPPGDVVEGSTVTLTCSSDANPPVDSYTWYTERGSSSISTGRQLVKRNVSPADSDQYTCQATNKHGSKRSPPHSLDVLYAPVDVQVEVSPSASVAEGSSVNLTCSSDANPPVHNYTWYKRTGSPGASSSLVVQAGSGQVLVLASLQPSHTGPYFCQARNSLGGKNSTEVLLQMDVMDIGRLIFLVALVVKVLAVLVLPLVMVWAWKQKFAVDKVEDGPHYVNVGARVRGQGFNYTQAAG